MVAFVATNTFSYARGLLWQVDSFAALAFLRGEFAGSAVRVGDAGVATERIRWRADRLRWCAIQSIRVANGLVKVQEPNRA